MFSEFKVVSESVYVWEQITANDRQFSLVAKTNFWALKCSLNSATFRKKRSFIFSYFLFFHKWWCRMKLDIASFAWSRLYYEFTYIFSYIFKLLLRIGMVLRKISIIMFMFASQRLFFLLLLVSFLYSAASSFFYLFSLWLLSCIQLTILCFILLHVVARCHLLWFLF